MQSRYYPVLAPLEHVEPSQFTGASLQTALLVIFCSSESNPSTTPELMSTYRLAHLLLGAWFMGSQASLARGSRHRITL